VGEIISGRGTHFVAHLFLHACHVRQGATQADIDCTVNTRFYDTLADLSTVKAAGFCTLSAESDQDLTNKMHFSDSFVCKQSNAAFSCAARARKIPQFYRMSWSAYTVTGY